MPPDTFHAEIARRRTFAIISHPDAGKTTLTEKLLLYGGAVQAAGSVRAKKDQRNTTSEWMELERERGISISSTVLQFEYRGFCINLLDTPGHRDFCEDTYRVLTAVDSVIMVIDAGKGIEERTRKLFEICKMRGIPIFTFMNKMDRPARNPLDLIDEVEMVLGIRTIPVTWPLGDGPDFKGVYDRFTNELHLFTNQAKGSAKAAEKTTGPDDPRLADLMHPKMLAEWREQLELVSMTGDEIDDDELRAGQVTPVFFGSGINNFGVQLLLDYFVEHALPPQSRKSSIGEVQPDREEFSGFVFKIQANMDPNHRDAISFVRVCSGEFVKDMSVPNPRGGRPLRLSYPQKLFGQERESVESAYPGDIVGLVSHGNFRIGDTLTAIPDLVYNEIPRFAPEVFCYLRNTAPSKYKQFREGLDQLLNEGAIQVFHLQSDVQRVPLLGAVGQLQFEVVKHRLETEYNAEIRLEATPYTQVRWLANTADQEKFSGAYLGSNVRFALDNEEMPCLLFPDEWAVNYFMEKNADTELLTHSPTAGESI
ncbi:MAG: peptide chain release factor 3 [Victivallales bacterium]|nr:peptide chain release factor 3 [Victivallales bacterium]